MLHILYHTERRGSYHNVCTSWHNCHSYIENLVLLKKTIARLHQYQVQDADRKQIEKSSPGIFRIGHSLHIKVSAKQTENLYPAENHIKNSKRYQHNNGGKRLRRCFFPSFIRQGTLCQIGKNAVSDKECCQHHEHNLKTTAKIQASEYIPANPGKCRIRRTQQPPDNYQQRNTHKQTEHHVKCIVVLLFIFLLMEIHKGSVHLGNPDEGQLYDIFHVLKKAPVFILKKLMQQKACRQEKDTGFIHGDYSAVPRYKGRYRQQHHRHQIKNAVFF